MKTLWDAPIPIKGSEDSLVLTASLRDLEKYSLFKIYLNILKKNLLTCFN